MAKFFSLAVFKKRPMLTTGIVVVGGLIVYLLFFRGSGETPAEQEGYTDANVNAATGLSASQMQAAARGQEIQGQLSALQIQGQNQLALASVQANTQEHLAALSLESARLDSARDLYGLQIQERIETLGIQTTAQVEQLRVSSELEALKVAANRDVTQYQIMTSGQVALSEQAANIAKYSMETTAAMAKMSTDAMIGVAREQTKASVSKDKSSTWTSAINAIGSIFCDRNIKTIGSCVDNAKCLEAVGNMPVEFWHYLEGSEPRLNGDGAQHLNTYSQDFYRELGADDWNDRKQIDVVDYLGALTGAVKALKEKSV